MGGPTGPATQEEMMAAKVPLAYRDTCAHLLIPLNKCRRKTFYMPWECGHERHAYEKCEYIAYKMQAKDEKTASAAKLDHH
mmetsp:Transcript_3655/g.11300  ORF Transcript_3655/g.11300 Transcript_3655/m.11300 type:complete len:81 (+) Transcript_3655:77-319(+)